MYKTIEMDMFLFAVAYQNRNKEKHVLFNGFTH